MALRTRTRRQALAASACALLAPLHGARAQTLDLVRFGSAAGDQIAPVIYGVKGGVYGKFGLNVDLQLLRGASTVAAALVGGSLEIGNGSSMSVIATLAKGLPLTVIANSAYYEAARPDVALIGLTDSPIKTPKDLEGKTLAAVSLQDMSSVATLAWLEQRGVDLASLKYVEVPVSSALAALEQNRIAAATIGEPFFSQAVASGKVRVLGYPFDAIARHFSDALLFAPTAWVSDHRPIVDRFLRATQEASAYVKAHESESTKLVAELAGFDPATLQGMHHAGRGVAIHPAEVQPVIDAAAKYNVIPKAFPASDIICACALR